MMFEIGQVVISKAGRDAGFAFVIVLIKDNYLYLADGKLRRLYKPKKKKIMHAQKTNDVSQELKNKLLSGKATDYDIAAYLKGYKQGG